MGTYHTINNVNHCFLTKREQTERKVIWFPDLLWLGVDSCWVVSACVKHDDGVLGDFGDVLAGAGEVKPAGRLVIIPGEKIRIH